MTPIETAKNLILSTLDTASASLSTSTSEVSNRVDIITSIITEFTSFLSADPLFNSYITKDLGTVLIDLEIVNNILKKRFGDLKVKINSELKRLLDLANNKRIMEQLSKQCHSSALCVIKKLVGKYRDQIVSATGMILSEVLEQLVECLNDIGVYADYACADKECPVIKYLWVFRVDILKTLTRLIPNIVEIGKSFILAITSNQSESLITKVISILATKVFSGDLNFNL